MSPAAIAPLVSAAEPPSVFGDLLGLGDLSYTADPYVQFSSSSSESAAVASWAGDGRRAALGTLFNIPSEVSAPRGLQAPKVLINPKMKPCASTLAGSSRPAGSPPGTTATDLEFSIYDNECTSFQQRRDSHSRRDR